MSYSQVFYRLGGCRDDKFITIQTTTDGRLCIITCQYLYIHTGCHITVAQRAALGLYGQDELTVTVLSDRTVGHDQVIVGTLLTYGYIQCLSGSHFVTGDIKG